MKKVFAIALLVLCMGAMAAAQKEKEGEPGVLGEGFVPVTDGEGTIRINSYGNTLESIDDIGFTIGGVGHLYEFSNFISINDKAVEKTGDLGWSIVTSLSVSGGTATSSVKRDDILQIDFTQEVVDNGGGLVDWFVTAAFTNLTEQDLSICYFPYLDYDLFADFTFDTATYAEVDEDFGVPTIRVQKLGRDEVFVFVDLDGISSEYRIGRSPRVRDLVERSRKCARLGNTGSPFGPGDFTAAFKFELKIAAGDTATVRLQLGRFL